MESLFVKMKGSFSYSLTNGASRVGPVPKVPQAQVALVTRSQGGQQGGQQKTNSNRNLQAQEGGGRAQPWPRNIRLRCISRQQKLELLNRIDARVSGNALVIEGRRYSHQDVGELPHGLSLEKAKTITCKDGITFQGPGVRFTTLVVR